MRVLGVDPGPTRCAWAVLQINVDRPLFVACGMVASTGKAIGALVAGDNFAFMSLETIRGYAYAQRRSAALIATGRVEGLFRMAAHAAKRPMVDISAPVWRRHVCGHASASDKLIAACVRRFVSGVPKRTNAHVRDAIGVALCGSLMRHKAALFS